MVSIEVDGSGRRAIGAPAHLARREQKLPREATCRRGTGNLQAVGGLLTLQARAAIDVPACTAPRGLRPLRSPAEPLGASWRHETPSGGVGCRFALGFAPERPEEQRLHGVGGDGHRYEPRTTTSP